MNILKINVYVRGEKPTELLISLEETYPKYILIKIARSELFERGYINDHDLSYNICLNDKIIYVD